MTAVEGAADLPYEIPNLLVDWQQAPGGVPTLWWRSVGHSHTAFVVESFLDELAHAAGKDPYEYRRALLAKHPRHSGSWNSPPKRPAGGSRCPKAAAAAWPSMSRSAALSPRWRKSRSRKEGKVKVHRVVCAIDCGPVVNPDTVRAQMEGGIVFGLTAALYGEITFENGRVKQRQLQRLSRCCA